MEMEMEKAMAILPHTLVIIIPMVQTDLSLLLLLVFSKIPQIPLYVFILIPRVPLHVFPEFPQIPLLVFVEIPLHVSSNLPQCPSFRTQYVVLVV